MQVEYANVIVLNKCDLINTPPYDKALNDSTPQPSSSKAAVLDPADLSKDLDPGHHPELEDPLQAVRTIVSALAPHAHIVETVR